MILSDRDLKFIEEFSFFLRRLNLKETSKEFEEFKSEIPELSSIAFARRRIMFKKIEKDALNEIAKKVDWLDEEAKKLVVEKVWETYQNKESKIYGDIKSTLKLLAIILSIPYAELNQDKTGTINAFIGERFKGILQQTGEPSSYTYWQIPVPHLNAMFEADFRNAEVKYEFFKKLNNPKAVDLVITIVLERIGILKTPERIFAEYNHQKPYCTEIAALQIYLNLMRYYALKIMENKFQKIFLEQNIFTEVIGERFFLSTLKEEDRSKMLGLLHKLEQDQKLENTQLEEILNSWEKCNVDGDCGPQLMRVINSAIKFFGLKKDFGLKEEEDIQSLWKVLDGKFTSQIVEKAVQEIGVRKKFGIQDIDAIPTYTPSSVLSRSKITLKVLPLLTQRLNELKNESRMVGVIAEILKKDEDFVHDPGYIQLKEKDDHSIVHFFRRGFFTNPYNVHDYALNAKRAYLLILNNIELD